MKPRNRAVFFFLVLRVGYIEQIRAAIAKSPRGNDVCAVLKLQKGTEIDFQIAPSLFGNDCPGPVVVILKVLINIVSEVGRGTPRSLPERAQEGVHP